VRDVGSALQRPLDRDLHLRKTRELGIGHGSGALRLGMSDETEFIELAHEDFKAELEKRGVLDGRLDPSLFEDVTILFWPASGAWLLKPRAEPDVEASSAVELRQAS
jgi:hypothetical protein